MHGIDVPVDVLRAQSGGIEVRAQAPDPRQRSGVPGPMPFPALRPYRRTYTPGKFPQAEFRALNGAITRISYGNRRTDASLDVAFQNVRDALVAAVLRLYEDTEREGHWVTFTANDGLTGLGSDLQPWMAEQASGLRWRFAEPPEVESVQPGLSSLRCQFVAEMDGV